LANSWKIFLWMLFENFVMWTLKLSELWSYLWPIFVNQMKSEHWCWMQTQIRECEKKVNWQINLKYFYGCYLKISDKLEDVKYWQYYRVRWLEVIQSCYSHSWVNGTSGSMDQMTLTTAISTKLLRNFFNMQYIASVYVL
jgi:hypothetical protein